ncbi:importin [Diplocarpon rosae]|nr:importin [Diplocarpon rosae]
MPVLTNKHRNSMEMEQLPSSLGEVEALITQLYRPGAPEQISNIQETLQQLQRSPQGWQLATSLSGHQDERVRFFAALTFTVKLNTDAQALSEEDAQALLQKLIGWLIRSLQNSEGVLVIRKLCSTLVAYWLQFSASWTDCVKHIMLCLCANEPLPYSTLEGTQETAVLVDTISKTESSPSVSKSVALFWFAATLVEEVGRTDSSSMKQHKFHRLMLSNVDHIVPLMSQYIANSSANMKTRQEAMRCFQSWVSYSHRAFIDDAIMLEPLQALTQAATMCLGEDDLYETTVELFSDTLTNYSKFLRKEDFAILKALLNSPWAQVRYERLVKGDFDFDSVQFGLFMIAFGDATVQDLARNCGTDPQSHQYLSALSALLGAEGYAVHEDKIYVPALEFWNTFVEVMVDDAYSSEDEKPAWFPAAQEHVKRVIERCWLKSQFPSSEEYNSWDSVDRTGFKDARRDFSDLLQQFYLTTGISLLQIFVNLIQNSSTTKKWAELEASTYCLACFADCISDDPQRDEYLDKVFAPSLISLFADPGKEVPSRAMKGFLDLVIIYPEYFQHRPSNLPSILNIVFGATSLSSLAKTASKAIMKLCSNCRTILLPELGAFLQHYGNIASNYSLDGTVKEAVMEGIASIIQALDGDEAKLAPLEQLIEYVHSDFEKCLELSNSRAQAGLRSLDLGIISLKCLAGIAKGIQTPEDTPVDLEKVADAASSFWTSGKGSHFQQRVYLIMDRLFDFLGENGDIVDEVCAILRHGFREEEPGPFVLPVKLTAQLLTKSNLQTPRLGRILNTSASLITSHKLAVDIEEILDALLNWVSQLLHNLGGKSIFLFSNIFFNLTQNPEMIPKSHKPASTSCIGSSHFPKSFFDTNPPPRSNISSSLAGTEPLPKGSAADFWATFISLQSPTLQPSIERAMEQIGPLLAQALIYNIGGHAARSELDKLSDPVKKLVVRQVHARTWFEGALMDASFPSKIVTEKDKRVFLTKIMSLRGARGTNQVIREFWLLCRGSNFSYAS